MSDLDETFTEASDGGSFQSSNHQECSSLPWLQEKTWRICGVLAWFLISDFDETFTEASDGGSFQYEEKWSLDIQMSDLYETFTKAIDGCSLQSDTNSRLIRSVHVLLDSRKRLGGQEESWHGSFLKLSQKLPRMLPYIWHKLRIHQEPPWQPRQIITKFWSNIKRLFILRVGAVRSTA